MVLISVGIGLFAFGVRCFLINMLGNELIWKKSQRDIETARDSERQRDRETN